MANPLLNKLLQKKNDQKTWIALGAIILGLIIFFLIIAISRHNSKVVAFSTSKANPVNIEPFQKISEFNQSATGEAISDLQTSESLQSQKIDDLTKENKKLTSELTTFSDQNNAQNKPISITPHNTGIITPPTQAQLTQQSPQNLTPQVVNLSQNMNALPNPSGINVGSDRIKPDGGIADFSFSYDQGGSASIDNTQCTPKNCVLPGTFVRAVMIGAADANASVNGQSNTTPIIFRILNRGILPNGYHSHMRGCFVVAEVYGDVSSSRGEVKLSQISCILNGKPVSRSINGIADYYGKEGIYGNTITKNGPMLWNAAISGGLSGLASGAQQAQQTQSTSPLGTTTTIPGSNIAMSMGAGSVQTAANTLANYYIKRADQYHPVIELNSGTIVNLVFLNQFLLTPDSNQSTGALPTTQPSNNYWKNPNPQGNASSDESINTPAYDSSLNSTEASSIQNQINQAGSSNVSN